MFRRTATLAAIAAALVLVPQRATPQPVPTFRQATQAVLNSEQVRVNIAINMFVPGPAGIDAESLKAQESARRLMYDLATKECAVLREVIASECRIESMNVNVNRHGNQMQGFQVGANMAFRVTLK